MDALLALEKALEGESSPPSALASAAGAGNLVGNPSSDASGTGNDEFDALFGTGAVVLSRGGSNEDLKECVQCVGCARDRDSGMCFVQAGEPLAWAFGDGRGAWCKDCFQTWRTVYSNSHSQTLMVAWLRVPENYQEWEAHLVAFLTLRQEGAERITQPMVKSRASTLRWYCRLMSLPTGPFVAKPLVEVLGASPSPEKIALVRQSPLFTMRTLDSDTIGVFLPAPTGEDASKAKIIRPSLQHLPVLRSTLLVSSETDRKLCREHLGVQAATVGSTDIMPYKAATAPGASPVSKLRVRLDACVGNAKTILGNFSRKDWADTVKESTFTKPLANLAAMNSEGHSVGDFHVIETTEQWSQALREAKSFMKGFRDYVKSHHKHPKLTALGRHLLPLCEFLKTQGVTLSASLKLLLAKVSFFDKLGAADGGVLRSLVPAMRALKDVGVSAVFQQRPSQHDELEGVSAEAWLRGILVKGLDLCIRSVSENEEHTREDGGCLAEDLSEVCTLISEMWGATGDMDDVLNDVKALQTILLAGSGRDDVSPTAVSEASKRMLETKLALIMTALRESVGGAFLWSGAQAFVARSAQDEVGDVRFRTALKFLDDQRLPRETVDKEKGLATIHNFDFVASMGVVDHLVEIMDGVNEAVSLWSKMRLDEKREALEKWATNLCDVCDVIDKSLSVHAFEIVSRVKTGEDAFAEHSVEDLRAEVEKFKKQCDGVLKGWLNEAPFRGFMDTCLSFGKSLSALPTVGKIIADRVAPIVLNSTLRSHVRSVTKAANECASQNIYSEVEEALEEFLAQDARGNKSDSFLACGLALMAATDKLTKACGADGGFAANPAGQAAEVTLAKTQGASLDQDAPDEEVDGKSGCKAVSWAEVVSLPGKLQAFTEYDDHVRQKLARSGKHVFEKLVMALHVDGLMLGASCVPATSVFEYLTSVVDPKKLCVEDLDIRRVFDDQLGTVVGRARSLFDLFKTLFDLFKTFDVEASDLWHTSGGEVTVGKTELFAMFRVLVPCSECATLFALLHKAFKDAKQVVVNFELRPSIPSAIRDLEKRVHEAATALTVFGKLAGKQVPWVASDKTLSEWVVRAGRVLPHVQKHCVQVAAEEVQLLATGLAKSAPKISHYVNDEHYLKPLAKKHLLEWKGKDVFSESTVLLFHRMSGLAKMHGTFGLKESLSELVPESESISKSVFQECKNIVSVVAFVNCIQTLNGEEQLRTAQELLAKKQTVPKALLAELEAIVAKNRGSKRKVEAMDETT